MRILSDAPRRERKKLATRQALQQAALQLTAKQGLEHVTIEDISKVADVATRTFFNYFDCKEDAIIGDDPVAADELRGSIMSRPGAETPLQAVRAGLREFMLARLAHTERRDILTRQSLIQTHPQLAARQLVRFSRLEEALSTAVAERLHTDPATDPYPKLLAALSITVMRLSFQRWAHTGGALETIFDDYCQRLERGV